MKVYVYPADVHGCGHYRLIWPTQELIRRGHDIELVLPDRDRGISARLVDGVPQEVFLPADADVIVLQRPTHIALSRTIRLIREKGVAVVIDMDDDLSHIHPRNPAWTMMHPDQSRKTGKIAREHSWVACQEACQDATLVTLSTPALSRRYAWHGRYEVLPNRVPASMFDVPHEDSARVGWPASLGSHPDDPGACGRGVARALDELGQRLIVVSDPGPTRRAFSLGHEPEMIGCTGFNEWPQHISQLGVAVAPLADTQFNRAKSWLKPLECAALGIPVIMSPRAEYVKIHKVGVGYLAKTSSDWYRHVARLTRDPSERQSSSAIAREAILTWTYERYAQEWADAWTRAYEIQCADRLSIGA